MSKSILKKIFPLFLGLFIIAVWLLWAHWLVNQASAQEPVESSFHSSETSEADAIIWKETLVWQEQYGPYHFWTYNIKTAFSKLHGSEPGHYFISSNLTLPEDDDIPAHDAIALADAALMKSFDITETQIAALPKDISFHSEFWTENLGSTRGWLILYRGAEPREDDQYPLLYQISVPSPHGEVHARRNFEVNSLLDLGIAYNVACKLTECVELFYIPSGGRFYHITDNCLSVPKKYRPLHAFPTGNLEKEPYRSLEPCPFCVQ